MLKIRTLAFAVASAFVVTPLLTSSVSAGTTGTAKKTLTQEMRWATEYYNGRQFDSAIDYANRHLQKHPNDEDAQMLVANSMRSAGRETAAMELYKKILDTSKDPQVTAYCLKAMDMSDSREALMRKLHQAQESGDLRAEWLIKQKLFAGGGGGADGFRSYPVSPNFLTPELLATPDRLVIDAHSKPGRTITKVVPDPAPKPDPRTDLKVNGHLIR